MLSIYIHGATESGFLDLDPGSSLDMEELMPPFDESLSLGEYSLPFEGILWTENNRRLLLQAQAINNQTPNNIFTCSTFDKGLPEIVRGKLTLLAKNGRLDSRTGKFSASISGSKGMYGSVISNKKLADLALCGRIEWIEMDSRSFAQYHMDSLPPDKWFLSFVPVAIETFFDQDRADYSGELLAKDCVNNLVDTGSAFVFGRPSAADESIPAVSATEEYMDYRTVPFFRAYYLLRQCFEEFGYRISGDFLDSNDFYNLLVFNNQAIEKYNTSLFTDENRSIWPQNHLPDILISDFLKGLFGLFSIFPIFNADNSVTLIYRKENWASKKIKNIDALVVSIFESTYEEGKATGGYKLNYTWDGADSYQSDRVKDLASKTLCATVNIFTDLLTLDIGRFFTTDDIALVEAENMYYQVADTTTSPCTQWDAWAERLQEYVEGDGSEDKPVAISTLCQYVLLNETTGLVERKNYLGCRQPGSYINNKGANVKNSFGYRVFYGSNFSIDSIVRPISYNHSRDVANRVHEKYSLAWLGDDGLAKNFHAGWQDMLRNKELVKLEVLASAGDMEEIRNSNIIELQSMHFVLQRLERSIPAGQMATLYLTPL